MRGATPVFAIALAATIGGCGWWSANDDEPSTTGIPVVSAPLGSEEVAILTISPNVAEPGSFITVTGTGLEPGITVMFPGLREPVGAEYMTPGRLVVEVPQNARIGIPTFITPSGTPIPGVPFVPFVPDVPFIDAPHANPGKCEDLCFCAPLYAPTTVLDPTGDSSATAPEEDIKSVSIHSDGRHVALIIQTNQDSSATYNPKVNYFIEVNSNTLMEAAGGPTPYGRFGVASFDTSVSPTGTVHTLSHSDGFPASADDHGRIIFTASNEEWGAYDKDGMGSVRLRVRIAQSTMVGEATALDVFPDDALDNHKGGQYLLNSIYDPSAVTFEVIHQADVSSISTEHGVTVGKVYNATVLPNEQVNIVSASLPEGTRCIGEILDDLRNDSRVTHAEAAFKVYTTGQPCANAATSFPGITPSSGLLETVPQYGPQRIDAAESMGTPSAADYADGTGVVVAVIDTGVNASSEWDSRTGTTRLLNGVSVVPFFVNNSDSGDATGHGTAVASVIAAASNHAGIVGVAPESLIFPIRIFDRSEQSSVQKLREAMAVVEDNPHIDIVNMSIRSSRSSRLSTQMEYLQRRGTVFVASSGNDCTGTYAGSSEIPSPGSYYRVLTVASTDRNDNRASDSCRGPQIDMAAPGVNVNTLDWKGGYACKYGTSFAAPHVAGVAALVIDSGRRLGAYNFSANQVKDTIKFSADPLPLSADEVGTGRVNALAAVKLAEAGSLMDFAGSHAFIQGNYHVDFTLNHEGDTIYALTTYGGASKFSIHPIGESATHGPLSPGFDLRGIAYDSLRDLVYGFAHDAKIYTFSPASGVWSHLQIIDPSSQIMRLFLDSNQRHGYIHARAADGSDLLLTASIGGNWNIIDTEVFDPSGDGFLDWAFTNGGLEGGRLIVLDNDGTNWGSTLSQWSIGPGGLSRQVIGPVSCKNCLTIAVGGTGEVVWGLQPDDPHSLVGFDFGMPFGSEVELGRQEISSESVRWIEGNPANNNIYAYDSQGRSVSVLSTNIADISSPIRVTTDVSGGSSYYNFQNATVSGSGKRMVISSTFSIMGNNQISFMLARGL